MPDRVPARPCGVGVFNSQFLIASNECAVVVANQTTGEQMRFDEHLKTIANTKNGHPLVGCINDLGHDRRVGGDCAASQIVAVRETSGENNCVYCAKVVLAVPEGNRLTAGELDCAERIAIVE